jgi:hypothetical protein
VSERDFSRADKGSQSISGFSRWANFSSQIDFLRILLSFSAACLARTLQAIAEINVR